MRRMLLVLAVVGLVATGCGDETPAKPAAKDPAGRTAEAATDVVEAYIKGYFAGDPKTCDLMTEKFQATSIAEATSLDGSKPTDCAGAVRLGQALAETAKVTFEKFNVFRGSVTGDSATVNADAPAPFSDTEYTLAWDGDRWLIDASKTL